MKITQKRDKKTIEFTVAIPWKDVSTRYEKAVDELIKNIEIKGFRKGKAPRNLAKKQLKKEAVLQETLKNLAVSAYQQALKTYSVTPITQPKISVNKAQEEKDWELTITVAEKPEIKLKNYKEAIQKVKSDKKSADIWVPGKEQKKNEKKETKPTIAELLDALYKEVEVEFPNLLIEQDVERRLSQLLSDAQKLGLTVDRYLASIGKTAESLRKEYEEQSRKTLTLEFALEKLADDQKIAVTEKDIEKFIESAKDAKEKESLKKQKYYVASLMRRQKTLEYLSSL